MEDVKVIPTVNQVYPSLMGLVTVSYSVLSVHLPLHTPPPL